MPMACITPFFLEHLPLNSSAQVIDTTASSFVEGYYRGRLTSHVVIGTNITDTEGFSHALQTAARQFIEAQHSRLDNGEGKEELIRQLVEKNENNSNRRYSRQCNICLTPSPDSRVTLTGCGHLICMACAMQIEVHGRLDCPFCKNSTGFVKMYEDRRGEPGIG